MTRYEHTCSPLLAEAHKNRSCPECKRQEAIDCTCPDWWFPPDRRQEHKKLAHGFGGGMLAHHQSCEKRSA